MAETPIAASLRRHGLLSLPRASTEALLESQMRIGLFGGAGSVPMLPTALCPFGPLPADTPAAVLLADHETFSVALVTWTDRGPEITERDSFPMPGLDYPSPWEDLIYLAAELAEPLIRQAAGACFCYALPAVPAGRDLSALTPPLRISGAEGRLLCASLTAELAGRGVEERPLVALDDACAALLAATVLAPDADRCLGLSWGRDVRLSLAAPRAAIPKLTGPGSDQGFVLLNTGVAGFTGLPVGDADLIVDRDAGDAGKNLLRKAAALPNLGETARFTLLKGVEDGLFTFAGGRALLGLTHLSFEAVDELLRDRENGLLTTLCPAPEDREAARGLCTAVCRRAVDLTASALSAALRLTGGGRAPCAVVTGGAEHTVLLPMLRQALPDVALETPEDAVLIGAAAGLLRNL
ncbi:MAG: hypothetical protein IKD96_06315 [Oscillospiraceae bacterium]|nr:hypothetical protein [Oscillospiraceae bacterium]